MNTNRPRPANHGAPWNPETDQLLLTLFKRGNTLSQLCAAMGRTAGALTQRLERLRVIYRTGPERGPWMYAMTFWIPEHKYANSIFCTYPDVARFQHKDTRQMTTEPKSNKWSITVNGVGDLPAIDKIVLQSTRFLKALRSPTLLGLDARGIHFKGTRGEGAAQQEVDQHFFVPKANTTIDCSKISDSTITPGGYLLPNGTLYLQTAEWHLLDKPLLHKDCFYGYAVKVAESFDMGRLAFCQWDCTGRRMTQETPCDIARTPFRPEPIHVTQWCNDYNNVKSSRWFDSREAANSYNNTKHRNHTNTRVGYIVRSAMRHSDGSLSDINYSYHSL